MRDLATQRERLLEMHATIVMLRGRVRECTREANEMTGGEEESNEALHTLTSAQMLLDAERDKHIALSHEVLCGVCPAHGSITRRVDCAECVTLEPSLRPHHEAYLRAVAVDAAEEAAQ